MRDRSPVGIQLPKKFSRPASNVMNNLPAAMPPHATWFRGAETVAAFLQTARFAGFWARGLWTLPTRANGLPAVIWYAPRTDGAPPALDSGDAVRRGPARRGDQLHRSPLSTRLRPARRAADLASLRRRRLQHIQSHVTVPVTVFLPWSRSRPVFLKRSRVLLSLKIPSEVDGVTVSAGHRSNLEDHEARASGLFARRSSA